MFCFQCEQTAKGTGCTIKGICGKNESTADLQDKLISSLIDIATVEEINDENTKKIIDGLFATITNTNFDDENLKQTIREPNFDVKNIWNSDVNLRSLKSLVLFGLKGMAAYAHHAWVLGFKDEKINNFFYTALKSLEKDLNNDELKELVLKTGEMNLKCMELLDKANTQTFGIPEPTKVTTNIKKGPFIVVTGHDLMDLKLLLEQTKDKNINIYTHGEMLASHSYPELKKYKNLKGNFGTAWQNQQKEFDNIPAPILFTTNCIMPPKDSYKDRVFTTSVVHYPQCKFIDEKKDFSAVIEKAIELKGYNENQERTGINGGNILNVGYSHNAILSNINKIIELIENKKINHIFLIGGCDGAKAGRNYYTELAELIPKDCIILTCACGKYRFNDIDFGKIEEIPRLLDLGQCNDSYSAIMVLFELSKKLNCNINDLPLSIVLSWYEQKAVAVLLTLLYLGIKNIKLGPSLPAFISEDILKFLIEKFNISLISTPSDDLKEMLK